MALYLPIGFTNSLIDNKMETTELVIMAIATVLAIAYGVYYIRRAWK